MAAKISIVPMSGALGAQVRGVDLSTSLHSTAFETIHQALLDYQVIHFPNQQITPHQHLEFAKRFGTPGDYPFARGLPDFPKITEIVKEPHEDINFGGEWHSDTTYLETPPKLTTLYAKEAPRHGGDTLFANMYLAYETLSPGMKKMLDGTSAIYSAGLLPREKRDGYATMQGTNVDKLNMSAEHPVVRTHPETGRKSLYINDTHTLSFKDMTREESLPLIRYLCERAVRPEFCCRLRWAPGTFTIWDNRCSQHFAVNDYAGQRRVMHRLIVTGDKPV